MNSYLVALSLTSTGPDLDHLHRSCFSTPYWSPDHQDVFTQGPLGITCTQRYVTPECHQAPMPYRHPSGCVVVGDIYLTYREELAQKLDAPLSKADVELIALAFLKWGKHCVNHLEGYFSVVIWDASQHTLHAICDHMGYRPFFYAIEPGQHLVISNTFSLISSWITDTTIDTSVHEDFVTDNFSETHTRFQAIRKSASATWMEVHGPHITHTQYWQLKKRPKLATLDREGHHAVFQTRFTASVHTHLRSRHPISAQLSGGLDSTSVVSVAAHHLKNTPLHAFSATSTRFKGPSFRNHWTYDESATIQSLLDQYPNVVHRYVAPDPTRSHFDILDPLIPLLDQPFRNIPNIPWLCDIFEKANTLGATSMLTGQHGNGTISWSGQHWKKHLVQWIRNIPILANPTQAFGSFFTHLNPQFLQRPSTKKRIRKRAVIWNPHYTLLSRHLSKGISSASRALELWYGVSLLDPTGDKRIIEYCYRLPQLAFYKNGKNPLHRRLLVREALAPWVHKDIRHNTQHGEQGVDSILTFHHFNHQWEHLCTTIPESSWIWDLYDRSTILEFCRKYAHIQSPTSEFNNRQLGIFFRCLSLWFWSQAEGDASMFNTTLQQ